VSKFNVSEAGRLFRIFGTQLFWILTQRLAVVRMAELIVVKTGVN